MTNRHYGLISIVILAVISLINCGGGGGAPGSTGSNDTGIMIQAVSVSLTTPDIDTFQNPTACSGKPEKPLTAERGTLNINTANLTPEITSAHFPATVEECTITYLKANEDPASPIIENLTIYPNCMLIEGSNTCPVILIDIARKDQYALPVLVNGTNSPAEYPTHYVLKYNCTYVNNFGKTGHFQTEVDVWLADWLSC